MLRRRLGFRGSSALGVGLALAIAGACNVYDSSLLTGGSEGKGGTSTGGEGGEATGGTSGTTGASGGTTGGGTGGTSGKGGAGGTDATGGTDTGGKGGSAGDTGGTATGGTATGGEGGEPGTGGDSGSGTGGKAGSGGDGGSGLTGGSGGNGGACGKCGCGMPETDTDMDGVPDCIDMCMGISDADCAVLRSGLVHRYSFSGTGTAVMDTKGTAHGTAVGTSVALSGSGTLVLAGGGTATADPKQHVDLPDNLLTGLTNATFEAWVTWGATTTSWQRIFDFGSTSTNTSGTYVFLTPRAGSTGNPCRTAISTAGASGETAAGGALANGPSLPTTATMHHLVVSVDAANDIVSLFVDGALGSTVGFTGTLAATIGTNNWLGRSNYNDAYFTGTFDEFRIYNVALTLAQARSSRTAGPNATFIQ